MGAGALGLALGMPYLAISLADVVDQLPAGAPPPGVILALQGLQLLVLLAVATAVGVALAPRAGLDAPVFRAWAERGPLPADLRARLAQGALWGSGAGIGILAAHRASLALGLPPVESVSPLLALGAIFYGGITEELLLRWGVLTLLVWLLLRLRLPEGAAFWTGNAGAALAFGALHLGAAAAIFGGLTPVVVGWVLVGNGAGALVFGAIYRRLGLEAAMAAHLVADVWLHVIPGLVA